MSAYERRLDIERDNNINSSFKSSFDRRIEIEKNNNQPQLVKKLELVKK